MLKSDAEIGTIPYKAVTSTESKRARERGRLLSHRSPQVSMILTTERSKTSERMDCERCCMRARHTKAKFEDEETKPTSGPRKPTHDVTNEQTARKGNGPARPAKACRMYTSFSKRHSVMFRLTAVIKRPTLRQTTESENDQSERTKRTRIVDASTLLNARPRCGIVLRDVHEAVPNDRAGNVDRDA